MTPDLTVGGDALAPHEGQRLRLTIEPAQAKHAAKWYELDRLTKFRDPILLVGFVLVLVGVERIYWPAALVVGGIGLMKLSWLMAER